GGGGSGGADAAQVLLDVPPRGSIELRTRSAKGAATTSVTSTAVTFPAWLKLSRSGTAVIGSVSTDGSVWRAVASANPSAVLGLVGMAVNSHSTKLNTSVFDNVTVTAPPGPPPSAPVVAAPSDGATSVALGAALSWNANGATSYDVKLGPSNPPPVAATGLTTATYTPDSLANGTTYYWQVVARNSNGTTTG